jgi:hypothetical protein|tara:strand:- start:556 stop:714 length:159 start_codon:yes stop_codon:yes gene_type:complete
MSIQKLKTGVPIFTSSVKSISFFEPVNENYGSIQKKAVDGFFFKKIKYFKAR